MVHQISSQPPTSTSNIMTSERSDDLSEYGDADSTPSSDYTASILTGLPAHSDIVGGYLWKKGFANLRYSRRYFVLSGKRLLYYRHRHTKNSSIPTGEASKSTIKLTKHLQISLGPARSSKQRYEVADPNGKTIRRSLGLHPIVFRGNKGVVLELYAETHQLAIRWVAVLQTAQSSLEDHVGQPSVKKLEEGGQIIRKRLSFQEFELKFPELLEELQNFQQRNRYMLARARVGEIEEYFREFEENLSLQSHGQQGIIKGRLDELKTRWEMAESVRQNVLDMATWADDWIGQFESNDGWEPAWSSGGVNVQYRKEENETLVTLKVDSIMDASFINLAALLAEADLAGEWVPFGQGVLLHREADLHVIVQVKLKFPFFVPFSNRDWVLEGIGVDMLENKSILIATRTVKTSPLCDIPTPDNGTVRINLWGAFYIKLISETQMRVSLITFADLKLSVSPAVLNFVNKTMGGQTLTTIKKLLKNFDQTKYPERMIQRREFYDDIAGRVRNAFVVQHDPANLVLQRSSSGTMPFRDQVHPDGNHTDVVKPILSSRQVYSGAYLKLALAGILVVSLGLNSRYGPESESLLHFTLLASSHALFFILGFGVSRWIANETVSAEEH